jgi:hypothetical protein
VNHEDRAGLDGKSNDCGNPVALPADPLILTQSYRVPDTNVLTLTPDQQVLSGETKDAASPAPKITRQASREVRDLIAKITALETAIADTADQWEPDDTGRGPYAGTASPEMTWQASETPGPHPLEAVKAADTGQPDTVEDLSDEQVVDEAILRALVAEVVREELQGELGQRISRNVRKVIRQEIRRALAAEALT